MHKGLTMITLNVVGDDYYDADEDCYVMTMGASIDNIKTDVRIRDDGTIWECYLLSVKFLPSTGRGIKDKYIVKYKVYD